MLIVLNLLLGILLLGLGGEWLVKGASRLAHGLGLPPLVIGLTVVAIGTSAPEFMVAFRAALDGHMDVSFGNIMGSNIYNAFFILGVCALARPFHASSKAIKRDLFGMVLCVALFWAFCLDLKIHPLEGAVLLAGAIFYTILRFVNSSSDRETVQEASEDFKALRAKYRSLPQLLLCGLYIALGLTSLLGGAHFLLTNAVALARQLGVSEFVIGLAVVTFGTSLPELVSSLTAVLKQKEELAVGNIIGSNIYNISLVLGGVIGLQPGATAVPPQILRFNLPYMLVFFLAWFLLSRHFQDMGRRSGLIFLAVYFLYLGLQL